MRRTRLTQPLFIGIVFVVLLGGPPTWAGSIVNGGFETDDLTGWTASAIDGGGSPVITPLVSVDTAGGNSFATFQSGSFATGPFISTLEQSFTVSASDTILSFDFTALALSADASGTGASPFFDSFAVSMDNGVNFFDLLLVDQTGASADPFGTASGLVTLGAASDAAFDYSFSLDMSFLVGQTVNLFFDVTNADDGSQFALNLDNVYDGPTSPIKPIPEPSTIVLLGSGIFGLLGARAIQRRRSGA